MIVTGLLRFFGVVICFGFLSAAASAGPRVTISIPSTGQIKVEAELPTPLRSWSFRNAYAGALGIAERVKDFRAFGEAGQDARVKQSAVGEFRSDLDATRISYSVKLSDPRSAHLPYVSWLAADHGLLMFADLVPIDLESLSIRFTLPVGWKVESSVVPDADGEYRLTDARKAVFFIGSSLRKETNTVAGMLLDTVVSGRWDFKDEDAWKSAARVMEKNFALTGFRLPGKSVVMIAPFPTAEPLANNIWKAETRGSTVVLLVHPEARKQMLSGQLGVIFTHEVLHLWVPNALNLEGDYDWFFEGFTMYTALLTALELKIIHFKEFLRTLGGAYQFYLDHPDNVSLIQASETRWSGGFSQVYIKGMLVAFLYDLMLRKESGGKDKLANRYHDLFNGGVADGANGNEAIIRLLGSSPALEDFTKAYIEKDGRLKLEQLVPAFGLQLQLIDQKSELKVNSRLDRDQKQLLRSFGY